MHPFEAVLPTHHHHHAICSMETAANRISGGGMDSLESRNMAKRSLALSSVSSSYLSEVDITSDIRCVEYKVKRGLSRGKRNCPFADELQVKDGTILPRRSKPRGWDRLPVVFNATSMLSA